MALVMFLLHALLNVFAIYNLWQLRYYFISAVLGVFCIVFPALAFGCYISVTQSR